MAVTDLIRSQRATRQFSQQPIPEEDIRAILNAGRRAQSSKNGQPWYFIVIRDREMLKRLSECGMYAAHVANAAFAVALITGRTGPADEFDLGQAAAYMQLAAWDRGIGSCLVAMHQDDKAKAVLNVPAEMQFRIAIDFGYPAAQGQPQAPKKGGRKTFDEVVRWEVWS
jgi:nitroreductase